jgi:hypothetical protein
MTPIGEKEFGKHPSQKPLQVMDRLIIGCTNEGDLVLDPFCGSGSTAVSAKNNNRHFYTIDNNSDYVTYQGEFHYSRFDSLVNMLEYIFDGFCEVVTHELHDIPIRDREYDSLNFNRLSKKISRKTELAAYDKKNIMKEDVANFLDILVSHEI